MLSPEQIENVREAPEPLVLPVDASGKGKGKEIDIAPEDPCVFNGDLETWKKALSVEEDVEDFIELEDEEMENNPPASFHILRTRAKEIVREDQPPVSPEEDERNELEPEYQRDIDESLETDVLKLPIPTIKRALLESFLKPIYEELEIPVTSPVYYLGLRTLTLSLTDCRCR